MERGSDMGFGVSSCGSVSLGEGREGIEIGEKDYIITFHNCRGELISSIMAIGW